MEDMNFTSPKWLRAYGFKSQAEMDTYYLMLNEMRAQGKSNAIGEISGAKLVGWAYDAGHFKSQRTGRRWLARWKKKRLVVQHKTVGWRFNRTVYATTFMAVPKW